MADFDQAPGGGELWQVGGSYYLAYAVPQTEPPVFMTWRVEDRSQLRALLGPGESAKPKRKMTFQQWKRSGALNFGGTKELANFDSEPFEKLLRDYKVESAAQPWLKDPEVLAVVAGAILEGREVTEAELAQTDYWKKHSKAERDWMYQSATDPQGARDRRADHERAVAQMLREAGVSDVPDALVKTLASHWVAGRWSESFIQDQVRGISDPYSGVKLAKPVIDAARGFDPTKGDATALAGGPDAVRKRVQAIFDNRGVDPNVHVDGTVEEGRLDRIVEDIVAGRQTIDAVRRVADKTAGLHPVTGRDITREGEDEVNQLVQDWLGPALAKQYDGEWSRRWAGKLRNDPDAQTELVEELKTLRMAAFPEWTNENLRYADVAPTTKALFQQVWKQEPGEDDPLFLDVLRMTGPGGDGLHAASARLRKEGLNRQVGAVVQDAAAGINQAGGGDVRQSLV